MRVRSKRESPEMTRLPPADHRLKYPGKKNAKPQLSDVAMAKSVSSEDLWFIHGNGYDLNEFVERHPGGKEAILLGRGRDCTALAESYHPFSKQHRKVLEKYCKVRNHRNQIGSKPDEFYDEIKIRVAATLKEKGIDPVEDRGASTWRIAYYVVIFAGFLWTGYAHVMGSVIGSFGLAIFGWLMGALGHDAGHFAASRIAWVNEWGVWAMALICNPILWQHQHTYGHHSFTNEFDKDPDLHHFDTLMRVHKRIRYKSIFRYQSNWLFVFFAYLFVVFGTCFYIPWGVIKDGSLYGIVPWQDKHRPSKAFGMRFHMALYVIIIMVVPVFAHDSLWKALFATSLHISTLGVIFAIFSQINHLNESSLEADMDTRRKETFSSSSHPTKQLRRDPRVIDSWAAAQVETSNNFASESLTWHFLSNGLNHQIEHHLFPGLNHCYLPYIAPVVRQTCKEYGVEYKSLDTWKDLMAATLNWYNKLSIDEHAIIIGTKKTD